MASAFRPMDPFRRGTAAGAGGGGLPAYDASGGGDSGGTTLLGPVSGSSGPGPSQWSPNGGYGPAAPVGGGGGGGFGGGGASPGPTSTAISAATSPALDALQGRYGKYLDNLEGNSGRIMDIAAGRLRDTREGGRAALQQSQGFRGVGSSNRLANYDASTQRGQAGAIADITTQREGTLGNALQGGLGIARAPADLALAEKGFGLTAANQQLQQQQQTFNQLQALLQATRTSPLTGGASFYTGY